MAHGMAGQATKLTYEDLTHLPADGKRHEIIDGEHYVTPSPATRHQAIARNLTGLLFSFLRGRHVGTIFHAPYDVVLSPHDVVEPDLLFVSAARLAILTEANAQGAPDLVVEILSPGSRRRDEIVKRDLYERSGVTEYWIVDPEAETVKVFRRDAKGGAFERPELLSQRHGDKLTTPLIAGLEMPLDEVFES
jgi:Uma2 family endonuclease